jgi:hypothetical protein
MEEGVVLGASQATTPQVGVDEQRSGGVLSPVSSHVAGQGR